MHRLRTLLTPLDVVSIGFLAFLMALCLIFSARVEHWALLVVVDLAVMAAIIGLAWMAERRPLSVWRHVHRWYCYPIVLGVFKQLYFMVRPIHPVDYDQVFIAIDRWMFGTDPTVWMYQFAHPVLTEVLQTAYFSYYLLFIIVGVQIYRRYPVREFDHAAFLIVFGFYLSYLGYFLMPAIGPRFTLHDFHTLNTELPGLLNTEWMRDFINAGESLPKGHPDPASVVQRDVFPSGHTQMTLLCVLLAFRYNLPAKWIVAVLATFLIVATVYLRYHYVVDLLGGVAFFAFTVWSGDLFQDFWERAKGSQG
ncbi:MAG: phosphatase PAP2 family protein [Bacteroidetes bacterium]|jgi:membrane-associated phospholipid phosphatase|nr:phosphatase PAP2 family protein [Bacteroidota bacterium]